MQRYDISVPGLDTIVPSLDEVTWSFGGAGQPSLTHHMVLDSSGRIEGYNHPNEAYWEVVSGRLHIKKHDGSLMWVSAQVQTSEDGRIALFLQHPGSNDAITYEIRQNVPCSNLGALEIFARQQVASGPIRDEYYLFPRDLEKTILPVGRVLLIGSCLTALYHEQFQHFNPETLFDYIPYNFASLLPDEPPAPVAEYSFQYIQIPLRTVLSDRVVRALHFNEPGFADEIYQDACAVIDAMLASAMVYNERFGLLSFVSNFIVPQGDAALSLSGRGNDSDLSAIVRRLNLYLKKSISTYKNTFLMDVDAVAASIGKRYILDDFIYFYTHGAVAYHDWDDGEGIPRNEPIPALETVYPIKKEAFLKTIYRQAITSYRTVRQVDQVKAVIFDLDNTLWRGQIAENYRSDTLPWPRTDGWPLGIWEAIHHLRARGILVALSSKNDLSSVQERWNDVVDPSFLSLDDFASVRVNWLPKAENIEAICSQFNITPRSVVFVDDNPVERASVTAALPEIRAIGGNPYLTRRILLRAAETQIPYMTDESTKRETMIKGQIEREETRSILSREEFLATLQLSIKFIRINETDHPEFARTLELTNKTNQFNTNGRRWSFEEVADFLRDGGSIISFHVADKFTEYGLVGVVYFKDNEIIQYLMSCRVLGMEVEQYAVAEIVNIARAEGGAGAIKATIVETKDNTPCRQVFIAAGFSQEAAHEGTRWFILPEDVEPSRPSHIQMKA